jgi:hypothetical protein
MTAQLTFRPMTPADLHRMHEWLQRPHIRRWWSGRETYEEGLAHYLPEIEGSKPTDLYVIMLGDRAAGFTETYLVADHPELARRVDVGQGRRGRRSLSRRRRVHRQRARPGDAAHVRPGRRLRASGDHCPPPWRSGVSAPSSGSARGERSTATCAWR